MILIHFAPSGARRATDLQDIYAGQTSILCGGSPSLKEQPIHLFSERGVLSMAINNAAIHFKPTMWVSGDNPHCYEPQILLDASIMKFAPLAHSQVDVLGRKYCQMPNIYFYIQEPNITWEEYLSPRQTVPWYNNTLFVGINILYNLGIRRIILAGSEFGFSPTGDMYAHTTKLADLEKKWNLDLYNSLVRELRMLKPVFDSAHLEFMDCSKNSRISQVYRHITVEEAVDLCRKHMPGKMADPGTLPHCSKFAPESIQKRIAEWPGHQVVGEIRRDSAAKSII